MNKARILLLICILSGCSKDLPKKELRNSIFLYSEPSIGHILQKQDGRSHIDQRSTVKLSTPEDLYHIFTGKYTSGIYHHEYYGDFKLSKKYKKIKNLSSSEFSRLADPVYFEHAIFIVNDDNKILKIDLIDNQESVIFKSKKRKGSYPNLSLIGNILLYHDNLSELSAIDLYDNSLLWTIRTEHSFSGGFIQYNDTLFCGHSDSNRLICYNIHNGVQEYIYEQSNSSESRITFPRPRPVANNNIIYFTEETSLHAIDPIMDIVLFKLPLRSDINDNVSIINMNYAQSELIAIQSTILLSMKKGPMLLMNLQSNDIIGSANIGVKSPIFISGNSLFFISGENKLLSLNINNGLLANWELKLNEYFPNETSKNKQNIVWRGPFLINNKILVYNIFGSGFIIDAFKGNVEETIELPKCIHRNPIILNDKIILFDDCKSRMLLLE